MDNMSNGQETDYTPRVCAGCPYQLSVLQDVSAFGGRLMLLAAQGVLRFDGTEINVTRMEVAMLALLAARAGDVVGREALLAATDARRSFAMIEKVDADVVRAYIFKLRRKFVTAGFASKMRLSVVWGVGYQLHLLRGEVHHA